MSWQARNKKRLKNPYGGKGWTMVNKKELEEKNFEVIKKEGLDLYYHEAMPELFVIQDPGTKSWYLQLQGKTLRIVKYMYQIDNMIHGFTDRWLGYV